MRLITRDQLKAVLMIQGTMALVACFFALMFWGNFCNGSLSECLPEKQGWAGLTLFVLAVFRPILFTPTFIIAIVAAHSFSIWTATVLTATGAACSALFLQAMGHYLGVNAVRGWLSGNMPATWDIVKQNQTRIIFFLRWITFVPFDLMSLLFGVFDFKPKAVFVATFLGILPESYVFVRITQNPEHGGFLEALLWLSAFGIFSVIPIAVFEFLFRKRGSSLWTHIKRTYYEVVYEIKLNNEIIKKRDYDNTKTPVILLYGFFSSRKALTIMERLLTQRGFQVMSFNLGGVLGVFFTRSIKETAAYINRKIETQMERHKFKKVHIIGHSKGGLVALWWLLRLNGSRHCDKVITMGTPFRGTYLTYLALASPLGFIWRDLWQMRPKSSFLTELKASKIPAGVDIFSLYSKNDKVAGVGGEFVHGDHSDQIHNIPMHQVTHFEFLYRRDVADTLARLLRQEKVQEQPTDFKIPSG